MRYRDRGIVGLGLGGMDAEFPPEPYARAFALARHGGLASVPHAGEVAGIPSIRGALEALGADRIRHGIRASVARLGRLGPRLLRSRNRGRALRGGRP